jgi:dihydrofolate reductase
MGRITATESITLDGIMQGPGRADEDTRGGFEHGGWAAGYSDEVAMRFVGEGMGSTRAMLFGARTYNDVLAAWIAAPQPNPFTDILVNTPKFVVSRSAGTVLAYPNSTLLAGDAVDTVPPAVESVDGSVTILGSGELVRCLHAAGLIDEYVLQVHPIVLGSGVRLFAEGTRADLTLVESIASTTGVIIARYTVH